MAVKRRSPNDTPTTNPQSAIRNPHSGWSGDRLGFGPGQSRLGGVRAPRPAFPRGGGDRHPAPDTWCPVCGAPGRPLRCARVPRPGEGPGGRRGGSAAGHAAGAGAGGRRGGSAAGHAAGAGAAVLRGPRYARRPRAAGAGAPPAVAARQPRGRRHGVERQDEHQRDDPRRARHHLPRARDGWQPEQPRGRAADDPRGSRRRRRAGDRGGGEHSRGDPTSALGDRADDRGHLKRRLRARGRLRLARRGDAGETRARGRRAGGGGRHRPAGARRGSAAPGPRG